MIKDALQYIIGLSAPIINTVNGHTYSDKQLNLVKIPSPEPLRTSTLQSIVDFIAATGQEGDLDLSMIHIVSPVEVRLVSRALRNDGQRETYLVATCSNVDFAFGQGYDQESFIVNIQTKFAPTPERAELLLLAGTIRGDEVTTLKDDGVTQTASFSSGKSFVSNAPVKNPWMLSPYRTFPEVNPLQPESTFFLRLKSGHSGVTLALNEVTNHAWEREAVANIADWLRGNDPDGKFAIIM